MRSPYTKVLRLDCNKGEVQRNYARMTTGSLQDLADRDFVVTRDGWVVKDRYGSGSRWATAEEMALVKEPE